jgi:hypothetical protein
MRLRNDSNVVSSVWIVTSREVVLVKEVEQQPAAQALAVHSELVV